MKLSWGPSRPVFLLPGKHSELGVLQHSGTKTAQIGKGIQVILMPAPCCIFPLRHPMTTKLDTLLVLASTVSRWSLMLSAMQQQPAPANKAMMLVCIMWNVQGNRQVIVSRAPSEGGRGGGFSRLARISFCCGATGSDVPGKCNAIF